MCWRLQSVPSPWKMGVIRLIPKSATSQDPHLSSNFPPIALTSCMGKLVTTLSGCSLWWPTTTSIRLCRRPSSLVATPGCFEQYQKLLLMIADAHKKHRSVTLSVLAGHTYPIHMAVYTINSTPTVFSTTMLLPSSSTL